MSENVFVVYRSVHTKAKQPQREAFCIWSMSAVLGYLVGGDVPVSLPSTRDSMCSWKSKRENVETRHQRCNFNIAFTEGARHSEGTTFKHITSHSHAALVLRHNGAYHVRRIKEVKSTLISSS